MLHRTPTVCLLSWQPHQSSCVQFGAFLVFCARGPDHIKHINSISACLLCNFVTSWDYTHLEVSEVHTHAQSASPCEVVLYLFPKKPQCGYAHCPLILKWGLSIQTEGGPSGASAEPGGAAGGLRHSPADWGSTEIQENKIGLTLVKKIKKISAERKCCKFSEPSTWHGLTWPFNTHKALLW